MNDFTYPHRNGETTPPEVSEHEFSHYWFDGIAHDEDWQQIGDRMIAVTGKRTDRVIGLVIVAMMLDIKKSITDGVIKHGRPTMIAIIETGGYDLDKCEGRWWGPVHVPPMSDDMSPTMAAVEDYEIFKRFRV